MPACDSAGDDGRPRIVVDGTDGIDGRALLLVSALYCGAAALADWRIDFIQARDAAVQTAIAALRWDTGLDAVALPPERDDAAFEGARLYAAVCFRDGAHLALGAAARHDVPVLIAIQFPRADQGVAAIALQRAAHDPALLCAALLDRLGIDR